MSRENLSQRRDNTDPLVCVLDSYHYAGTEGHFTHHTHTSPLRNGQYLWIKELLTYKDSLGESGPPFLI